MVRFGLIGKDIEYSFSRQYFREKFAVLGLNDHVYENFDLVAIEDFPSILRNNPDLKGLNVTIPYKEEVIPYLNGIDPVARKIGAVNTIKIKDGLLIGYNTDAYGFKKALEPLLPVEEIKALILGTGGASKAIAYVLEDLEIPYSFVSRNPGENRFTYSSLTDGVLGDHLLIINCTPLGTYPEVDAKPQIPYKALTAFHILFDLVYNPENTAFMKAGTAQGCRVSNGLEMLRYQAEKAWSIWQE